MTPGEVSEPIGAEVLPSDIGGNEDVSTAIGGMGEIMSFPLKKAREAFEREYLNSQVARFGGNISRTAAFVGMERSALHRKLKSLGIQSKGGSHPGASDDDRRIEQI
mgnify:CR=1 FL=1